MKMFVTGAGGMVGSYVPDVFRDVELVLTDIVDGIESLDITDARSVNDAIARAKPDGVLHLAAATDVAPGAVEPEGGAPGRKAGAVYGNGSAGAGERLREGEARRRARGRRRALRLLHRARGLDDGRRRARPEGRRQD